MFCFVSFMRALVCLALLTIRIRLSRPLEDTLEAVTDTFDTEASDEKQYRLVTCVIFVMNGLEESFHFEVPGLNCRNCFGSLESFLASFTPFENRQRNASRPYRTSFGRESIGNEPFANLKKDVIKIKRYQNINMIKWLYSFEYVQVACAVVYCSKPMHLTHTGLSAGFPGPFLTVYVNAFSSAPKTSFKPISETKTSLFFKCGGW